MTSFVDARYCLRRLRRDYAVCVAASVCIALGFGGVISVARLADELWFGAPPGVGEAGNVRRLFATQRRGTELQHSPYFSHAVLSALKERLHPEAVAGGVREQPTSLRSGGLTLTVDAGIVTGDLFDVFGVAPSAGRLPSRTGDAEAVLSQRLAFTLFSGAKEALGQTIYVGPRAYAIVGVMAPGFLGAEALPTDVWVMAQATGASFLPADWATEPNATMFRGYARLRSARSEQAVLARASDVLRQLSEPSLVVAEPPVISTTHLALARSPDAPEEGRIIRSLLLLALLVWLAVCANVGGLMVVRAVSHQHDTIMLIALGCPRYRVLGIWTFEALLVCLVGVAGGAAFVVGAEQVFRALGLVSVLRTYRSSVSHILTIGSLLSLSVVTGAIVMAARATGRLHIQSRLQATSPTVTRSRRRAQSALLFGQVFTSAALLYVAWVAVESFGRARGARLGFDPTNLYAVTTNLTSFGYSTLDTDRTFRQLHDVALKLPSVQAASLGVSIPFLVNLGVTVKAPRSSAPEPAIAYIDVVTPGHFAVTSTPLLRGRDFDETIDRGGTEPVTILTADLAKELFRGSDALGECVIVGQGPCRTVIGIVGDQLQTDLRSRVTHAYLPLAQDPELLPSRALFLRIAPNQKPDAALSSVSAALTAAIPGASLQVSSMERLLDAQLRPWRLSAGVLSGYSLLALVVVSIGIFGLMSYNAAQSLREAGLRAVLGARATSLAWHFAAPVIAILSAGTLLGIACGFAVTALFADQLYATSPASMTAVVVAALVIVSAAVVASLTPMRTVLKPDLATVLRAR